MTFPVTWKTLVFFCADTETEGASPQEGAAQVGSTSDLKVSAQFDDLPMPLQTSAYRDVYRQRCDDGHACLHLAEGGRIAHTAWIARNVLRIDELRATLALQPEECCIYDVSTDAAFRGRGLYPAMLAWVRAHARAMWGCARVRIYAESGNAASLRGIAKAGYEEEGRVSALMLLGASVRRFGTVEGLQP